MSNYTQKQETEIVRDAMMLTAAIRIGEEELENQREKVFKLKPSAPKHKKLEIPEVKVQMPPEPTTSYSFTDFMKENTLYIVFSVVFWPFLIYAFVQYSKKKNEILKQLKQGPDYQKALKEAKEKAEAEQLKINSEIAKQQAEIDKQYDSDLNNYNSVIIPTYNQEYEAWKIAKKMKIEFIEEEVNFNKETLDALYSSTRLISNRYRNFGVLQWLYDELSSSDITFERAVDLYENENTRNTIKNVGSKVTGAINSMHSAMLSGFNAIYEAVDEGNETLAKTRRDQNLANTASIIQRHNLNKMIKSQNEMLDKHFNQ